MEYRIHDIQISPTPESLIDSCHVYLAKRGIKQKDIDDLGILICQASDIGKWDPRAAIVFPHYSIQGELLDWWSARLVEHGPKPVGFNALTAPKGKMYCPPKEPPAAYLAPTLAWDQMEKGDVVFIHESVIKAIAGVRCNTYSIGLNGVWGWGSKKHEVALLAQLKDLPWHSKQLKCVVVFDSNAETNDDVALAIRKFAERMALVCKTEVRHLLLPKPPEAFGQKDWGFDDYCVYYGDAKGQEFLAGWQDAPVVEYGEVNSMLLQLNEEVCVVRNIKRVVEQQTGTMMGKGEFTDMNYAHYTAWSDDTLVNVPKRWLTWERRRSVERLEYTPGGPPIVDGEYLNLWRGLAVEPMEGDVSKWLAVLEYAVPNPELRHWVTQWLAYPLQNLGAKLNTYIHMYGPPGGGKNALLAPILGIYGDNGIQLGRERIASDFNEVYATKQFINLDELHGGKERDGVAIGNKIKMLTTAPKLTVNGKGKGEYTVTNHVNLCTTSNYLDAIKLDDGDRRACVLRVGERNTVIRDKSYWMGYFAWALSVGGQAALLHYLLGYDLTDFDPMGWAPMTEDKEHATDATRGPMEKWVRALAADKTEVLPPMYVQAKVLTPEMLAHAYVADDPMGRVTPGLKNSLGQMMREYGFESKPIKVDGITKRVWLLEQDLDGDVIRKDLAKFKGKV